MRVFSSCSYRDWWLLHSFYCLYVCFSGKDVRLTASMADSIGQLKKQLEEQQDIDVSRQRWFFSGKLLTDQTRLQDTKIQKDFVVQVIVNINGVAITKKWMPGRNVTDQLECGAGVGVGLKVLFQVVLLKGWICVIFYIWYCCFCMAPFCIFSPFFLTNVKKHWNILD